MINIIKGTEFEAEVLESEIPVLVDLFAVWCGPCKMIAPVLEELAGEVSGLKIVKLDIDDRESREIIEEYDVRSVPTLLFFKEGRLCDTIIGAQPKAVLLEKLGQLM